MNHSTMTLSRKKSVLFLLIAFNIVTCYGEEDLVLNPESVVTNAPTMEIKRLRKPVSVPKPLNTTGSIRRNATEQNVDYIKVGNEDEYFIKHSLSYSFDTDSPSKSISFPTIATTNVPSIAPTNVPSIAPTNVPSNILKSNQPTPKSSAFDCAHPLVNSVYCPFHDVSNLQVATHEEASVFGRILYPPGGSTLATIEAGYAYLYDGVDNSYNLFKTYPSYTTTKSEVLMLYDEFYGPGYAPNTVVKAALNGEVLNFDGPALVQDYSFTSTDPVEYLIREESAKKINQYTTALLQMYQLLEKAVQEVKRGCISYVHKGGGVPCNTAVDIWDEAAAIQEGPNYLGVKRCQNYLTCGFTHDNTDTIAIANTKVLNLFQVGQSAIRTGDIVATKAIIKLIQSAQIVPYIQGVGRYAWKISDKTDPSLAANNKYYAEGAAFATGMLPQLHKCNRAAAKVVDKAFQIKLGNKWEFETFSSFFDQVRAEYQCLGITCEDIGGLWDGTAYYLGAEPCVTVYGNYFIV